jgi:hypothetical protein
MRNRAALYFGGFLVLIGLLSLLSYAFHIDFSALCFPLVLIAIGVWLIARPKLFVPGSGQTLNFIGDIRRRGTWKAVDEQIVSFVGDITLDLSQAELASGLTTFRLMGFVGDVNVYIPQGVEVAVSANGFVIDGKILDEHVNTILVPIERSSPGYDTAERRVRIETAFFVNNIRVKRI